MMKFASLFAAVVLSSFSAVAASDVDPLTLSCAQYLAKGGDFGVRVISAAQRQNIVMFDAGYAAGTAAITGTKVGDKAASMVDLVDEACARPEFAKRKVIDVLKYLTLK